MALERKTYTQPLHGLCFKIFGKKKSKKKTWPQRVRGSQWLALKTLGVGPVGASIGADLGGSSKYSSEILED
ncbi:Aromatic amino acid exporter YddG [Dirofilaria immitis]